MRNRDFITTGTAAPEKCEGDKHLRGVIARSFSHLEIVAEDEHTDVCRVNIEVAAKTYQAWRFLGWFILVQCRPTDHQLRPCPLEATARDNNAHVFYLCFFSSEKAHARTRTIDADRLLVLLLVLVI